LKPVRNSRVIGRVKDALSRGDLGELLKYKFVAYAGNMDLKTRLYFRVLQLKASPFQGGDEHF